VNAPAVGPIDGGEIGAVLDAIAAAIATGAESDVPCGTCTACCRSSQFVDVAPDEIDALARIPAALLVAAPGRPPGHRVLGYDEHGCCPMLGEHGCTIYEHRPRACRVYDCRIFAVAGVEPVDKPLVDERVRRWTFREATSSTVRVQLVRRAAEAIAAAGPSSPTRTAVLAVEQATEDRPR